jgi:hypothetical protein
MDLTPNEVAALRIAMADEDGRIIAFDPNDGPLSIIGPSEGPLVLGADGLMHLIQNGFIRREEGSSYLITSAGRTYIKRLE